MNIFLLILSIFAVPSSASWWLLSGVNREQFNLPSTCRMLPGLTAKQRELCARHPDAMKFVVDGLRMAVSECQHAFQNNVWNCSITGYGTNPLKMASKESAYVYAIASAGVSHALARACAKGEIEACGCGAVPMVMEKEFVWAGCSDNVKFGNGFGRKFIDIVDEMHNDFRGMMNVHNNRVGRRLLSKHMKKQCKCHGVSGSCVTKTCWKVVPRFDEFATMLYDKYEVAQQVTGSPHSTALMVRPPVGERGRSERYLKQVEAKKAAKNDLVFLDQSPDYCNVDGQPATNSKGRECGSNCQKICCGRGFHTVREVVDEPCHCQFIWCCEVKCKTCSRVVERNYCR